jgi:hypothetical protein
MLFKVLILLSAAGVKIRERKHPSAARDAERAAALLRQLMKVPDRAFERALGMYPRRSRNTPLVYSRRRVDSLNSRSISFSDQTPLGARADRKRKAVIGGTRYEFDNGRSIRGHRLQFLAARHPSGSRLLPQVRKSWPEIRPAPCPRVLRMTTSFIIPKTPPCEI